MQEAVQYQMRSIGNDLHDGDVILTNHPAAGGNLKKREREEIHSLDKLLRKSFARFNGYYTGKIDLTNCYK
jgi:hypothetical protein